MLPKDLGLHRQIGYESQNAIQPLCPANRAAKRAIRVRAEAVSDPPRRDISAT